MIQRNFLNPVISWRPTILIRHRITAMGCRKIASRISMRSFMGPPRLHQGPEWIRDRRPATTRGEGAVDRLQIGRLQLATGDLSDSICETIDLGGSVVRRQARPHRAGQCLAAIRRHLAFDRFHCLLAHVQKMEDIWVRAEAAVTYGHAPFVAEGGGREAVVDALDDEAGEAQSLGPRPRFEAAENRDAWNLAEAFEHARAELSLVAEHVIEAQLDERLDRDPECHRPDHLV